MLLNTFKHIYHVCSTYNYCTYSGTFIRPLDPYHIQLTSANVVVNSLTVGNLSLYFIHSSHEQQQIFQHVPTIILKPPRWKEDRNRV